MISDDSPGLFTKLKNKITFPNMVQQVLSRSSQSTHQEHLDTSGMTKVIVIGETGSGKSTFINYLTNYFKHGTLNDLRIAIPSKFHPNVTENFSHEEHDLNDKTQSKTDSCNQYMFADRTAQYLFIDTPGLSDTRGAQQDVINMTKIIEAVETLGGLTAVIIVVNGAITRLTVNLRNVITQMRGNLPDVVMDNVIVILTNAYRHAANFTLTALELNGNVYPYYMQNSAFSNDPAKWTSAAIESLQCDWNQAMHELKIMVETLNTFKTKSVSAFKTMKDIRNEIKALMHKARMEVTQIQKMQDEIAMFEAGLKQAKIDTVTYKDYTKDRTVDDIQLVDAPYHSTLCQNCNHVCHDDCKLTETTTKGSQIFERCWAMKNGNCIQCQHKCSYTAHYHAKKTVKVTKKKLQDVLADIKSKFDIASKDSADFQKKITSTEDAKKLLEKALKQKNDEIKTKCHELRRICSGFNLAAELHALIDQLEMESAMLRNIDAKKQAETFIRSLKEFCGTIEKDENEQKANKNLQKPMMTIIDTDRPVEGQVQPARVTLETKRAVEQTSQIPIADSSSHASDDVLNQIRILSGQQSKDMKKQNRKKTKKKDVSSDEKEEPTSESEHDDDESDEEKTPAPQAKTRSTGKKKSKVQSPPTSVAATTIDPEQFKALSISELLNRYRACEDQRMRNFIIHELTQRSHGKSMLPLTSSNEIVEFTASTQKYSTLEPESLRHTYAQLKDRICAITEPDILKIDQVPPSLLIDIAAIYLLCKRASDASSSNVVSLTHSASSPAFHAHQPSFHYPQQLSPNYPQQLPPNYPQQLPPNYPQQLPPNYPQQLPPNYPQQLPPNYPQQLPPNYPQQLPPNYSQQLPPNHLEQPTISHHFQHQHSMHTQQGPGNYTPYRRDSHYGSMSLSSESSHPPRDATYFKKAERGMQSPHSHFPQADPQYSPYPSIPHEQYRQSPMNSPYSHQSHFADNSSFHRDMGMSQSDTAARPIPSQTYNPSKQLPNSFRTIEKPTPVYQLHMPAPSVSNASIIDGFNSMHVSSAFIPPPSRDYPTDRSHLSPVVSKPESSSANIRNSPFDASVGDLRKYTDKQLLSAYYDANIQENQPRRHAIYNELQRRCYGDHPALLTENQQLFGEKRQKYERHSLNELKQDEIFVHQQITNHLPNSDPLYITMIPKELIVEAASLAYLIQLRAAQE